MDSRETRRTTEYAFTHVPNDGLPELRARVAAGCQRAAKAALECFERSLANDAGVVESGSLLHASDQTWLDLRDCVHHYVRLLQAAGEPPERTLALLKHAVHSVSPSALLRNAMLGAVVPWFLEAYYGSEADASGEGFLTEW